MNRSAPASSDAAPAPLLSDLPPVARTYRSSSWRAEVVSTGQSETSRGTRAGIEEGPAEAGPRPRHLHRQPYCRRKARPSRHRAAAPVLRPSSADRRPPRARLRARSAPAPAASISMSPGTSPCVANMTTRRRASSRALSISLPAPFGRPRRREEHPCAGRPAGQQSPAARCRYPGNGGGCASVTDSTPAPGPDHAASAAGAAAMYDVAAADARSPGSNAC